ncbi:LmbE family N-acetylglucosaminyl deacetylase [Sphingomonas sp. PvP055]|uniref:PIG-L deacetylase family protein n=1 Tax=Sphingomonas sp. PvP055 TaxID=3156391 RepID=UPI003396FEED
MKALRLHGVRSALIVAPHPDDEAIGAFGLMRLLKRRGARVRVIIVTDGAGSHPGSRKWPRTRLVATRRRETRAVLRGIGIGANDVRFLALPDGGLTAGGGAVRRALARALAQTRGHDLLVMPARDDDHPDHRVVAAVAADCPAIRRLEYLVWPNRQTRARPATHAFPLGVGAAAKRGAILRYRSQFGMITDDPGGFTIARNELAAFAHPVERYREASR